MCNNLSGLSDYVAGLEAVPQGSLNETLRDLANSRCEISEHDRRVLLMIIRQHYVTDLSYSGEGGFNEKGELQKNGRYKYRVCYDNSENGKPHVWVFLEQ